MSGIKVQTARGTFHISPRGQSVTWKSVGMQALCEVHGGLDGNGRVLASFINPLSVEFIDDEA